VNGFSELRVDLTQSFEERRQEIDAYLDFLEALERLARGGQPKIGDQVVTAQQQRILYSSVFLQLYNLVEATVTRCLDAVAEAVAHGGRWRPSDLTGDLRREWIRATARTHTDLNYENRLASAVAMCDCIIQSLPMTAWGIEKGGGGNWDDDGIEDIARRMGFQLRSRVSQTVYRNVKRPIREDRGALALVKYLRNSLAHGDLSFAECGADQTVADLRLVKERTENYLSEVVQAFSAFISDYEFLQPASRPEPGAPE
jgi:hypothetical protein